MCGPAGKLPPEADKRDGRREVSEPMRTKRVFDRDFKLSLVRQLASGEKRLSQLCRENNLCENVLRRWKTQYDHEGENAWLEAAGRPSSAETDEKARIRELEAALGRAHLEIEFLRLALEKKPSPPRRGLR